MSKAGGRPFEKGDPRAGRPKGTPNKVTAEVRLAARGLMEDPAYLARLRRRLRAGKCAPAVECMLWHYAYGKPKDQVEVLNADKGGSLDWLPGELAIKVYEAFLASGGSADSAA